MLYELRDKDSKLIDRIYDDGIPLDGDHIIVETSDDGVFRAGEYKVVGRLWRYDVSPECVWLYVETVR